MAHNETGHLARAQAPGEGYLKNPWLRGLVNLVPSVGGAVDTTAATALENLVGARSRAFFEELGSGNWQITPEMLEEESFVHAFMATANAAARTSREEKIRALARMLKYGASHQELDEMFEEHLDALDQASMRDLRLLSLLREFENEFDRTHPRTAPPWGKTSLRRARYFWMDFLRQAELLGFEPFVEVPALLSRASGTGLCHILSDTASGDMDTGDKAMTTPLYSSLTEWIQVQSEE